MDEAKKLKKDLLLFKVDFEKAYHSVDWAYLDSVLGRMSFLVLWRKWIKECVSTATTSVLVNGSPTNVLMKSLVQTQLFTRYSFGVVNPVVVSHLQFANDTLLLETKNWANIRALRAALVIF